MLLPCKIVWMLTTAKELVEMGIPNEWPNSWEIALESLRTATSSVYVSRKKAQLDKFDEIFSTTWRI